MMHLVQQMFQTEIVQYVLIATSFLAMLSLFFVVKKSIRRQQLHGREQYRLLEDTYLRLENKLDALQEAIDEARERTKGLVPPPSAKSGLNLNKRAQAARMLRRGERPEQIAAVLSLPQNEVNLLLKVHRAAAPN
jgi:hypothetical protein